ncbi:MAG: hypothetical protein JSS02_01475 [Planctomycetes bacterium]|nr:hypothetical protein [Planctomycetota bacterium]
MSPEKQLVVLGVALGLGAVAGWRLGWLPRSGHAALILPLLLPALGFGLMMVFC